MEVLASPKERQEKEDTDQHPASRWLGNGGHRIRCGVLIVVPQVQITDIHRTVRIKVARAPPVSIRILISIPDIKVRSIDNPVQVRVPNPVGTAGRKVESPGVC